MDGMDEFDFYSELFDSRDVVSRINWLESDEDALTDDEKEELIELNELRDEFDHRDFDDGMTFIRDDYFEKYAQEFAEDIGAINDQSQWPNYCIDWEYAARELQMDYTSTTLRGTEYWAR